VIPVSPLFDTKISLNSRPQIFAEVEFRQVVTGFTPTFTATGQAADSQLPQLANGASQLTDYARLEYGGWPLDGSKQTHPDIMTGQVGAEGSGITDATLSLSTPMVLTANLSALISTVGLSFYFDTAEGTYPPSFTVAAYNGATLVDTFTATPSDTYIAIQHPINNYNKIVATFTNWNAPGVKARVPQIVFGIVWIIDNKELVEFSVIRPIDPTNMSVQSGELQYAFDNRNGNWDFENPVGVYDYITLRSMAIPRIGFDGELVQVGVYYLSDWGVDQSVGKATQTAQDVLSLTDIAYSGYFNNQTLAQIAQAFLGTAGVTNYILDSSLNTISATAYINNTTCRQGLAWVATAACLTLYADSNGNVVIGSLPTMPSGYAISYLNAKKPIGTMDQPLWNVEVKYGTTTDLYGNVTSEVASTTATYGAAGRQVSVSDNPFITTLAQATAVCNWLATYYQRRKLYQNDWRQNPKLEPADIIGIQTDFGTPNAQILSQQISFSGGGMSGQTKSRGL
jgi:hypothetical protein